MTDLSQDSARRRCAARATLAHPTDSRDRAAAAAATSTKMSGVEQLQAMFPDAAAEALEAVLSMLGGDVAAATNFLLGEEGGGGGGAAPP